MFLLSPPSNANRSGPSLATKDGKLTKADEVRRQPKTDSPTSPRKTKPRKYVDHTYHDYCHADNKILSWDDETNAAALPSKVDGPRRGVDVHFPVRLHIMLGMAHSESFDDVFSWQPHGRCFKVHDSTRFVKEVMPRWFKQTKLRSFHRQLNLYGFARLTKGPDRGAYYHEMFLRGHLELCSRMTRTCVKGTGVRPATSPSTEPDFYKMTPCEEESNASDSGTTIEYSESQSSPISFLGYSKGCLMRPSSEPHCIFRSIPLNDERTWMGSFPTMMAGMAAKCPTPGFTSPRSVVSDEDLSDFQDIEFDPIVLNWSSDGYEKEVSDEMEFEGHRFHYLNPDLLRW